MGFDEKTGKLKPNAAQLRKLEGALLIVKLFAKHPEDYPTAAQARDGLDGIVNPKPAPATK